MSLPASEEPVLSVPPNLLSAQAGWARDWLFNAALPFWLEHGADHARGGWFDKLGQDGVALPGPKRLRVQARQAFVYAEAGRLGWAGPWEQGVKLGIEFMLAHYRRPDGFFRASTDVDGQPVSEAVDLYDQAFVIFALAAAFQALGRPQALLDEAQGLLHRLTERWAHPRLGFEEGVPRILPLRSNPHMHMLEAMLAWLDAGVRGPFETVAHSIVQLATQHLIDPDTGGVGEYFDGDWAFDAAQGSLREPGHQFEWAYLLDACEQRLGGDHSRVVRRLVEFGNMHGIVNGFAIFAVDARGVCLDQRARLWAQTERLRTMTVLARRWPEGADALACASHAREAMAAVQRFMAVPVPGLWSDWLDATGHLVLEPAPASSLYHLVTGLAPLIADH